VNCYVRLHKYAAYLGNELRHLVPIERIIVARVDVDQRHGDGDLIIA
jgi:hypothetical protein